MPAVDLLALIRKLPPGSALAREESGELADWDPHKENTARLLEIESYKLEMAWIDRTTDPDDPAVKRERAQAKRNGIHPPPHPLVPPVALRPAELAQSRLDDYLAEVQKYSTPTRERRQVGTSEFDKLMGLND